MLFARVGLPSMRKSDYPAWNSIFPLWCYILQRNGLGIRNRAVWLIWCAHQQLWKVAGLIGGKTYAARELAAGDSAVDYASA